MKQTFQKIECRLFNHSNDMKCFLICCNSTALWQVFCDVGIQVNISLHHSMKLNIKPSQAKPSQAQTKTRQANWLFFYCIFVGMCSSSIVLFSIFRCIEKSNGKSESLNQKQNIESEKQDPLRK